MLNEMAEDYAKKKRTFVLSRATDGIKNYLMDILALGEKGVSWPNKPSLPQCSGFEWLRSEEDSEENRNGYLDHLRQMLKIPQTHQLADVQSAKGLLSADIFLGATKSLSVQGTTDVVIARSEMVCNDAIRSNIETLLELKNRSKCNILTTPRN